LGSPWPNPVSDVRRRPRTRDPVLIPRATGPLCLYHPGQRIATTCSPPMAVFLAVSPADRQSRSAKGDWSPEERWSRLRGGGRRGPVGVGLGDLVWSAAVLCSAALVWAVWVLVWSAAEQSTAALHTKPICRLTPPKRDLLKATVRAPFSLRLTAGPRRGGDGRARPAILRPRAASLPQCDQRRPHPGHAARRRAAPRSAAASAA